MNLQETIRRILREEDSIPLESLYLDIKDYDGGFDVFIMNGDKKIGEISFAKESLPNLYTIVDATIDDEYKGNRIYPKTIINLFKERPNIIINSLFRSPEANKAWIYLLSNLPPNIGKSVKYYKEEDTTLFQLKLRNLQENISRIKQMMGIKESFVAGVWGDEDDNYSVDKLVNLVKDRKPEEMNIDDIIDKNKDLETKEGNFYKNIIEPTELFKKRTMKANTKYPIMISQEGWIIDGSHRVAKQKWQGKNKIKVHIISKKDLKLAKITDDDELKKSQNIKY